MGWIGANASLGGMRLVVSSMEKAHKWLEPALPLFSDLLLIGQVLVAAVTIVYMVCKLYRTWKHPKRSK